MIKYFLNMIWSDRDDGHSFDLNQTVGDCWFISAELSDPEGHFNRGVQVVQDMQHSQKTQCVMKVLPSEALYSGYAEREIDILYKVQDHPNVVQIRDAHVSHHRHVSPWIIMDLCNAGTLKTCIKKNDLTKYRCAPKLFIWHVFESLVEAVRFCRYGLRGEGGVVGSDHPSRYHSGEYPAS
jgi:serine/threonine protein kinase